MRKEYKCVFFDLDHTLWDYERNAEETLADLYREHALDQAGIPDATSLYRRFREVNLALWDLYDRNLCDQNYIRTERFKRILEHFSVVSPELCNTLSEQYLDSCPRKNHLIPHAHETLEYLAGKYQLTVVTNGFEEIQHQKLASGDLRKYFKHIVTSQKAGHKKPAEGIFHYAMNANGVSCDQVVMIGDNLVTDMGGAIASSIDTVFLNRDNVKHQTRVTHEISCLSELPNIL